MAFRAVNPFRTPLVIILGATGTGKTKLSLELAQKYGTEIISADSMQIYKGLDLVTAKATQQERSTVPHHLLDILEPHQKFTVVDFRNRALKIIESLEQKNKIPIVVGGTNYYLESIVFKILVQDDPETDSLLWDKTRVKRNLDDSQKQTDDETSSKKAKQGSSGYDDLIKDDDSIVKTTEPDIKDDTKAYREKLLEFFDNEINLSNEEIHDKLKEIDPVMAGRLHSNNRRKVLRSIEVFFKTGRCHSEVLEEQKTSEGQLRRPGRTIILWLQCERAALEERLDARVQKMLDEGLIEELLDFHARHNRHRIQEGSPPDYTKGVFQSLGFKEFHDYLMLTETERISEHGKELLQSSIENMKLGTRRFARRQEKMVRGRFLEHPRREVPLVYKLDTTNLAEWDNNVKNKAMKIIDSFLDGSPCEYEPLVASKPIEKIDGNSYNFCETCKRHIIGDKTYKEHMNSNRHKKVLTKLKLEAEAADSDNPRLPPHKRRKRPPSASNN